MGALEETSFWFKHRNEIILSILRIHPPQGRILDVGGGNGYVSQALQRAGFETTVIEPGSAGVALAQERGLDVIQASFSDAAIEAGSATAIGTFDVIEHIENDIGFLQGVFIALRPGARLYLTVPAYSWLWSNEDVSAGHYRRYSLSQLKQNLATAGFKPLHATYFFSCLIPPVFLKRRLPYLIRIASNDAQKRAIADHAKRKGIVGSLLNSYLASERRFIAQGRSIPAGTSLIVVAEKPDSIR